MGLFDQGSTVLQVSYPKNNYKFGDVMPLQISVDNTKGKKNVTKIKINFKRVVTLKRKTSKKYHHLKIKVFEKRYPFPVNSNTSNQTEIHFTLTVPNKAIPYYGFGANPYGNNITNYCDFLPTVESLILTCEYYIKVSCYFNGFVTGGYRPAVKMPIAISHQVINEQIPMINNQIGMYPPINNPPLPINNYQNYNGVSNINNVGNANVESAPPQPQKQMVVDINQPVMYDKI